MDTILKMYNHLNWANHRIMENLTKKQLNNSKAIQLFSHILQAEQVWYIRLQGKDSANMAIWSDLDLSQCAQLIEKNERNFTDYLRSLSDADLHRIINYRNQAGKKYETSVQDILLHVALHGQYHRGQINSSARSQDIEPINVDYITFVR